MKFSPFKNKLFQIVSPRRWCAVRNILFLVLPAILLRTDAAIYVDEFKDGAPSWNALSPGWSTIETTSGRFGYRGDFTGDTLSSKTNIVLGNSWSLSAGVEFKKFYDEEGYRGAASFALFSTNSSQVQLLATITQLTDGTAHMGVAWFDKTNSVWRIALNSGWRPGSSKSYRVELSRIAGEDKLYFKAIAGNGFSYYSGSEPVPFEVLNSLQVPGLGVNNAQVDFTDVEIATPIQQRNHVLALDGAGDYMTIPSAAELQNPTGITIECWLQPTVNSTNHLASIINKGDGLSGVSARSYDLRWTADERITASLFFALVADQPDFITLAAPVQSNHWTHIAVTFDSSNGSARLITNGIIASEWENSGSSLVGRQLRQTTEPLVLGWTPFQNGTYATGWIDEVRIWNRSRSAVQIRANLACKLSGIEPNLVGYWNFDDFTGKDQTANENDGLLFGDAHILTRATADMALIGCDPLVFLSERKGTIDFQWYLRGRIGSNYLMQSSTNLMMWDDYAPVPADRPIFQFDPLPTAGNKFYRAVLRP